MTQSIIQFETVAELAETAAETIVNLLAKGIQKRGVAHLVLSGGGTPKSVFAQLTQPENRDSIDWQNVHFWWADERLVPPKDDGSNYKMAWDILLSKLPVDQEKIHRIHGEHSSGVAVQGYIEALRKFDLDQDNRWPKMDVVLLGMGRDGHTASLFPGPIGVAELSQPVIAAEAHYDGRPAARVSLTPLVFNEADSILFLVTGAEKGEALAQIWRNKDKERFPTQRISPRSGSITWFIDREAGRFLDQLG